jgi:hypothetical protein
LDGPTYDYGIKSPLCQIKNIVISNEWIILESTQMPQTRLKIMIKIEDKVPGTE